MANAEKPAAVENSEMLDKEVQQIITLLLELRMKEEEMARKQKIMEESKREIENRTPLYFI